MSCTITAALLAALLPLSFAQTSTTCNPLESTCPSDPGLDSTTFNTDFTQGSSSSWSTAEGTTLSYGTQGAEFQISTSGQAPTIASDFYIFFGHVDVTMKAAPGVGIVSSIVLESDDLDEIDWEFLGGDTTQCETNFFGKGNTTLYDRAIYYNVANPQSEFHTYSLDWTAERLEYIIDGVVVRTLAYDDPLTVGGSQYPQTPMRVKLGNWAGGGPGEPAGTVQWAGGDTDFSQGPFNMYVSSINITNYTPGSSYTYGDRSGSYGSITVAGGSNTNNPSASVSTTSPTSTAAPTTLTKTAVTTLTGSSTTLVTSSTIVSASTDDASTAPTSSLAVNPIKPTGAVATTTIEGSAYSTNSASVAAQNTMTSGMQTSMTTGTQTTNAATSKSASSTPTGNAAAGKLEVGVGAAFGAIVAGLLL